MTAPIVVLGAGVAGLACAVRLVSSGRKVTLLEARRSPGGRAASVSSGESIDNGQHLFLSCYHDTSAFLRVLGTDALIRYQPRLAIESVEAQGRSRLRLPPLPSPLDLLVGVARLRGLGLADRLAFLRAGPALRRLREPGSAEALETTTVTAWLDALGQTTGLRRILWHPLTLATLNEGPDRAPASLLARVIQEAFLAGPRAATIGIAMVGLSELYALPAIAWLRERGAEVLLGDPATRLAIDAGRVTAVERRGGPPIPCQTVISALPPEALRQLQVPLAGLDRFETSPILSINLWLDRPLAAIADFDFIGLPSARIQWLFNRERILEGRARHLAAVISAARDWVGRTNEELATIAWEDIQAHLPAARAARVVRSMVVRERNATFASTVEAEPLRPGPRSPCANLVLAGDWTMRGMPATIEAAARSGHRAAGLATASPPHA